MNTAVRKHVVTLLVCILLLELAAVCIVIPAKTADAFDSTGSNKMIALTFDDGPSEYTGELLEILNSYDAKATFCVVGSKINANQQVLQKALSQGCEIIGHTWNHNDLTTLTYDEVKQELLDTNDALYKTLGIAPKMFRPPFGETNANVIDVAKDLDSAIILWSISTLDWQTQSAEATYNSIMSNVHNGAIILCHDTVESTLDAMKQVLPELNAKGYTLVTLSELLGETEAGQIYRNSLNGWTGITHTVQLGESLWSISKLYSTTLDAIKTLNGLTGDTIFPGQVLAIIEGTPIVPPTIPPDFNGTVYTVQQGDSLSTIAKKFNTTVDAIKALNGLTSDVIYVGHLLAIPEPVGTPIVPPTIPPDFNGTVYTVQQGDALWFIAQKFSTTVEAIKILNGLTNDAIYVGWQLAIPENMILPPVDPFNPVTGVYTVQKGDTLWLIANKFDTTVDAIKALNNLTSDTIYVGQELQITQIKLTGITITEPNKTEYTVGEVLNLAGLIVTATYSNGKTSPISGYTTSPVAGAVLSNTGTQIIVVSYVENGVTRSNTFIVKVKEKTTLKNLSYSYSPLVKQGSGSNGYGETTVTLAFELSDGTTVRQIVPVSNIKWGVSTVKEVQCFICEQAVTVTITIVTTGNNINQLAITNVIVTYPQTTDTTTSTSTPDSTTTKIVTLIATNSALTKQGSGSNGYGETTVTLAFELSDGTTVRQIVPVSNIKWGVSTVKEVQCFICEQAVTVTITIVTTGNNINQLAITKINATYTIH